MFLESVHSSFRFKILTFFLRNFNLDDVKIFKDYLTLDPNNIKNLKKLIIIGICFLWQLQQDSSISPAVNVKDVQLFFLLIILEETTLTLDIISLLDFFKEKSLTLEMFGCIVPCFNFFISCISLIGQLYEFSLNKAEKTSPSCLYHQSLQVLLVISD